MTAQPDTTELRALEAAATPGPWVAVVGQGPKRRKQQTAMIGRADMRGMGELGCLAVLAGIPATKRADDADLIVAMRNNLLALLDENTTLRHQIAAVRALALREAADALLAKNVRHHGDHCYCQVCAAFEDAARTIAALDQPTTPGGTP